MGRRHQDGLALNLKQGPAERAGPDFPLHLSRYFFGSAKATT